MMQFNIGGKYLDLYADTDLQFTRKNLLFAFDSAEVSRTASFEIPASPKNNAIFALANDAARDGANARMRFPAQLQYSGGVENGYFYVMSAERDKYSCIFIFGELLGLKEIKDEGKIADIYPYDTICVQPTSMNATKSNARVWDNRFAPLYYVSKNGNAMDAWDTPASGYANLRPNPSFALSVVTDICMTQIGVGLTRHDTAGDIELYRVVLPKWNGADGEMSWGQCFDNNLYRWNLRLQYNLPDITLLDLLKIEANLLGRALWWNGTDVEYDAVNFASWGIEDLERVVSFGTIERTFANYGQHNLVNFNSADYVENHEQQDYQITNTNIQEEYEVYKIPFSEGEITNVAAGVDNALLLDDVEGVGGINTTPPWKAIGDKFTIGRCGFATALPDIQTPMLRADLPRLTWLETLCNESTSVKCKVLMSLKDFNRLPDKKILQVRGQLYVWTAATWQNGIASLELSKVAI